MLDSENGFSLVEMVMATAILSVGITGILSAFLTVSTALDKVENQIHAVCLLEKRMNDVIEADGGLFSETAMDADGAQVDVGTRRGVWKFLSWELVGEEGAETVDLVEVQGQVEWIQGGQAASAMASTYFTRQ